MSIHDYDVSPEVYLMIGDAQADIDAVKENNISFVFLRHQYNQNLNIDPDMQVINDFKH